MKRLNALLAGFGDGMRRHARLIRNLQWAVVLFYAVLLVLPALLPLPDGQARMLDDLTLFAQFVFWGLWWPFVLLSVVLFGQGPAQVNDADQLTTPGGNRRTPNATVMPPGKPVRAGAGARQAAIGWVRSRDPAIGTWSHAWDSVKAALDMEPEAIFLLTDGEFDRSDFDDLVLTLEAHPHAPQVRLHTIAFATDGDVTSMRDLAARWRGVYRHVPLGP